MKQFLKHHGLWILFAAAVIAVALACMSYFSNTSSPLSNLAGTLASPFRAAYSAVTGWISDKQAYYADVKALEEENAELKQQIAQMEAEVRQAENDRAENDRLREALNLKTERQDITGDLELATVTEHPVSNWTSSLTLNKGTAHGVEVNDCVITETGSLVGLVGEVGYNWCTVLTLVDTDTSLGARVFRTKDLGVAHGDFSLMEENRLRLDYLPAGCQLMGGDLVLTSGLADYYPADLVIGTVEEVQQDDSGAATYAILAPEADFDQLEQVFIIKSFVAGS